MTEIVSTDFSHLLRIIECACSRCGAGIRTLRVVPTPLCEGCEQAQREAAAAEKRREEIERLAERFPARFRWAKLEEGLLVDRIGRRGAALAAKVVDGWPWPELVTLVGRSGAGKTSAAVAIARRLAEAGAVRPGGVRFLAARDLVASKRSSGFDDPRELDLALRADLLILDDVGSGVSGTAPELATVVRVIMDRHDRVAPTLVTSGHTNVQLAEIYGAGVARRLAAIVNLGGA